MAFELGLEGYLPFIYVCPFMFRKELIQIQKEMQEFYFPQDGADPLFPISLPKYS